MLSEYYKEVDGIFTIFERGSMVVSHVLWTLRSIQGLCVLLNHVFGWDSEVS